MSDSRFAQSTTNARRLPQIIAVASMLASLALAPIARTHADAPKKTGAEWLHDGNLQLQSNNPEKALEAYDRAQLALPDSAKVSYNRGLALYQLGRFDEAETALQNALRPDALDLEPDVKYSLGRCAQAASMATDGNLEAALNNAKRAVEFYSDALQLRADDADTQKNLAIAESQQKYFEKLIEIEKQKQQEQPEDQQQSQDPSDEDQEKKDDQQQDEQSGEGQEQEQSEGQSGEQNSEEKSEEGKDSESASESSESKSDSDQQNEENKDQQAEQGAESDDDQKKTSEGQQDENDKRSDEQLGDDQLEDAQSDQQEKREAQEMNREPESESDSEGDEQQEAEPLQAATTQSATSMPSENPMEMAKRISIEKAQRLLQTARDKEARRREALRRAQLRNRGRARVEKDW